MKIKTIDENSSLLKPLIKLGDKNRRYLGFFPREAFVRSASEGLILCAVDDMDQLCGYLLYYVARGRAVIQQLCVDSRMIRKGVGRALVDRLKNTTTHLDGILLHCCRDFPSHQFWPQLGFVAVGEKLGRGGRQTVLTRYWYDHGHPTLFSRSEDESKVAAVLDANVLFDLQNGTENESAALLADWLNENVELKITNEVWNEIDRQPAIEERKSRREFAQRFQIVEDSPVEVERIITRLRQVLPKRKKRSDESDRRQLAMAVSGDAEFFITRDQALYGCADKIFQHIGITVAHPAEFVLRIDELLRRADYQPLRLSGSDVKVRRVGAEDVHILSDVFLSHSRGEKKSLFENRLRSVLAQRQVSSSLLVEDAGNNKLGFVVICQESPEIFTVPFFRVKKGTLAPTLARNMAMLIVKQACSDGSTSSVTILIDPHLDGSMSAALQELGFSNSGDAWVKVNLLGIDDPKRIAARIKSLSLKHRVHVTVFDHVVRIVQACAYKDVSHRFILNVERKIWPAKLTGSGLPTFIVPIQPRWAMHLFDEELANQTLFGAVAATALACENVYYRSKDPKVLEAPGRVLWYVSEGKHYEGSKSIRACSVLHEVVVGKAKELYQRFRRLGIYGWSHVRTTAKGNARGEIMAFRFGLTETFSHPISWRDTQAILRAHLGTEPPLSTPLKISEECFEAMYMRGTSGSNEGHAELGKPSITHSNV